MSDAKMEAIARLKREAALHCRRLGHTRDSSSTKFVEAVKLAMAMGITGEEVDAIIEEAAAAEAA